MPRKKGYREGMPGQAYPNRTDLNQNKQPIQTTSGQTYGERTKQEQSQQAVPLPQTPTSFAGSSGAFVRPTERPQEPVTAGVSVGPGPGPEVLPYIGSADDDLIAELHGLYAQYPSPEIFNAIQMMEQNG